VKLGCCIFWCASISGLDCKVMFGCVSLNFLNLTDFAVRVSEYLGVWQFTFAHTCYATRPHTIIQAAPIAILEERLDTHFGDQALLMSIF